MKMPLHGASADILRELVISGGLTVTEIYRPSSGTEEYFIMPLPLRSAIELLQWLDNLERDASELGTSVVQGAVIGVE